MRRPAATVGSLVFFLLAPGVFAGLVPWLLTGFESRPSPAYGIPLRVVGTVLVVAGAAVLVQAFARFVLEGSGTPAPIAPTERLVVGGLYRYVRNPMYLAVLAVMVGLALALWQPRPSDLRGHPRALLRRLRSRVRRTDAHPDVRRRVRGLLPGRPPLVTARSAIDTLPLTEGMDA